MGVGVAVLVGAGVGVAVFVGAGVGLIVGESFDEDASVEIVSVCVTGVSFMAVLSTD